MMKLALILLGVWSVSVQPSFSQVAPPIHSDHDLVLEDVQLRPNVVVDLHLKVFVDEARPCIGRTIVAVPGFAHTAETFGPLAEAMFAAAAPGQHACRVIAVDLPGHGDSGLPSNLPFGFLTLDDYVTAVLAVLERLDTGAGPDTVLAHSQGGLLVQLAQQRLTAAGTNLREAFGVKHVVLLAPVPPQQVFWGFADSGFAVGILSGFLTADAVHGPHFAIPDAAWVPIFFSNLFNAVSPYAPATEDIGALGYNAPEPLISALELVGALELAGSPATPRRGTATDIFGEAASTSLHVVTFAHDLIIRPLEGLETYVHLTGDLTGAGVVEVAGESAVHDMYISEPATILEAIAGVI